jgi:hypothetical protein
MPPLFCAAQSSPCRRDHYAGVLNEWSRYRPLVVHPRAQPPTSLLPAVRLPRRPPAWLQRRHPPHRSRPARPIPAQARREVARVPLSLCRRGRQGRALASPCCRCKLPAPAARPGRRVTTVTVTTAASRPFRRQRRWHWWQHARPCRRQVPFLLTWRRALLPFSQRAPAARAARPPLLAPPVASARQSQRLSCRVRCDRQAARVAGSASAARSLHEALAVAAAAVVARHAVLAAARTAQVRG